MRALLQWIARQRKFSLRRRLLFACLFANRQRLFVGLPRGSQVAAIRKSISDSIQHECDRALIVDLCACCFGPLIGLECCVQFAAAARNFGDSIEFSAMPALSSSSL